jgi:hypothetical protein
MTRRTPSSPEQQLVRPTLSMGYLEEAPLQFGAGRQHVSTRTGIALFGPRSLDIPQRHPLSTKVGIIGSGRSLESAQRWMESCLSGVEGDAANDAFPGYTDSAGFYANLVFDSDWNGTITQHDIAAVKQVHKRKDRFTAAVELVSDKVRILSQKDYPPSYLVLALPDELLEHCKTVDYVERGKGQVHRDFHRALKAELMRYRIPTQILLQRTSEAAPGARTVDHKSRVAWNYFSGLYFKAGGIPWSPTGLSADTCYIGISFYRALGSTNTIMHTSVAQAFNEHGDGLVLRGPDFQWDASKLGKSPHLTGEQAETLLAFTLKRYRDEMNQLPRRVVIHKSSRFWPEERDGFSAALKSVSQFDMVAVRPNNRVRLLREGQYPPLRGTTFSVGDIHYLYTTGYIPALRAYPHGHVPSPLQVADYWGDTPLTQVLREILVLTRMNWNTTAHADLRPITLRFSQFVGDIMREVPADRDPLPQFKYYM